MEFTTTPEATMFYAEQIDGRPEDDLSAKWSVIDGRTDKVVASWQQTPTIGMTETDATELAAAWNQIEYAL